MVMLTTLVVLLICGKTGWSIEVEDVEYVFSLTLEIERMSNLHKHTKEWERSTAFFLYEAENDVRDVSRQVFEFIITGPIAESRAVEQILEDTITKNSDWLRNHFVQRDAFMPQGDDSKRFHSLAKSIEQFMPSLSIDGISTDILSRDKVSEYLKRSIYNDMFDWIRRTNGQYPLNKFQLNDHARFSTAPLAEATFKLINSKAITIENKRLVITGLLEVAFKNALNEKFFSHIARGRIEIAGNYVGNYAGNEIVAFSKIVEGLVESSTWRDTLKTMREDWLEKPKKLA